MAELRLSTIRVGDRLVADNGFTCLRPGAVVLVEKSRDGLFVPCDEGRHGLYGQVDHDDPDLIVGFVRIDSEKGAGVAIPNPTLVAVPDDIQAFPEDHTAWTEEHLSRFAEWWRALPIGAGWMSPNSAVAHFSLQMNGELRHDEAV